MNDKIQPRHLERIAFVYVRQSSLQQVRDHREGQRRQYALVDRARALGFRETVLIDEDQGRSGSGRQERPGFGRLLAGVCQGSVGAVFALEAWGDENVLLKFIPFLFQYILIFPFIYQLDTIYYLESTILVFMLLKNKEWPD